jgi:hypothetical protein
MEFVEGLFTNVNDVAINKVGVEVDSNTLKEEKTSKLHQGNLIILFYKIFLTLVSTTKMWKRKPI